MIAVTAVLAAALGPFVTPVRHDELLADLWLRGVSVPLRAPGAGAYVRDNCDRVRARC